MTGPGRTLTLAWGARPLAELTGPAATGRVGTRPDAIPAAGLGPALAGLDAQYHAQVHDVDELRALLARIHLDCLDSGVAQQIDVRVPAAGVDVGAETARVPVEAPHLIVVPRRVLTDVLGELEARTRACGPLVLVSFDHGEELTTDQLGALLIQRNLVTPAGTIDTDRNKYFVHLSGQLSAVEEIEKREEMITLRCKNGNIDICFIDENIFRIIAYKHVRKYNLADEYCLNEIPKPIDNITLNVNRISHGSVEIQVDKVSSNITIFKNKKELVRNMRILLTDKETVILKDLEFLKLYHKFLSSGSSFGSYF